MDSITVATFNSMREAIPLQERLSLAGIKSKTCRTLWFLIERTAGVKVKVDKKDWNLAKGLIQEWKDLMRNAIHCPQCSSSRVQYPQLSRKFVTPWIVSALFPFLVKKQFYCQECHYIWSEGRSKMLFETSPKSEVVHA
jgi:hypothetical protein